jgi:hypothetical protein
MFEVCYIGLGNWQEHAGYSMNKLVKACNAWVINMLELVTGHDWWYRRSIELLNYGTQKSVNYEVQWTNHHQECAKRKLRKYKNIWYNWGALIQCRAATFIETIFRINSLCEMDTKVIYPWASLWKLRKQQSKCKIRLHQDLSFFFFFSMFWETPRDPSRLWDI